MTTYLNYIIEANIGLVLFLAFYRLLLRRETHFRMQRTFMLAGVVASLTFPLLDFGPAQAPSPLSMSEAIPTSWLPGITVGSGEAEPASAAPGIWSYLGILYVAGLIVFALGLLVQLRQIILIILRADAYRLADLHVAESREHKPTFSFFNFIFIGKADTLSIEEKQQIIRHESVHARQLHSVDILLINGLKVFFWFNPFLRHYEKTLVQLHEFEADARAVDTTDVDKYCSLLAKVALASADFKLANHFNSSLTIKRITMIRTVKNNISFWKLAMCATMFPAAFLLIGCQEQLSEKEEVVAAETFSEVVPATPPEDFYDIVRTNLTYPATSRANHNYGKVLVQFVINEDGSISDTEVLDSPDEALAQETLRILKLSPQWTAAKSDGKLVKQKMVLPISFRLDIPGKENDASRMNEKEITTPKPSLKEIVVIAYASK